MHYVRSSNLDSIGYDAERSRLIVRFGSGNDSAYAYAGVPASVFQEMLDLARERGSVGGYLARSVKGTYPFERMKL